MVRYNVGTKNSYLLHIPTLTIKCIKNKDWEPKYAPRPITRDVDDWARMTGLLRTKMDRAETSGEQYARKQLERILESLEQLILKGVD